MSETVSCERSGDVPKLWKILAYGSPRRNNCEGISIQSILPGKINGLFVLDND